MSALDELTDEQLKSIGLPERRNPKVGDKIRVTYTNEGVVDKIDSNGVLSYGRGEHWLLPRELEQGECALEILERAKPVWQDGDVAICTKNLNELRYRKGGKWFDAEHDLQSDSDQGADFMKYKLVLRDGKPVQA